MNICPHCLRVEPDTVERCSEHSVELLHAVDTGDARVGHLLEDRYLLLERLAVGRIGIIYRAYQRTMERMVAIKMLRDTNLDRTVLERFRREARIMARLRSPHTATVYDFGQLDEGALWIAMELIPGCSLADLLTQVGHLDLRTTVSVLRDICLSLEEAHRMGLVHRDLKPANVMVEISESGYLAKVTDFGVAKVTGASGAALTGPGVTVGSPAYMAPEQAMGELVGPPADLYSLGCLAFEMLTGRHLFDGTISGILHQHISDPPPEIMMYTRERHPAMPDLEAVVMRCLEKEPRQRFPSARALRMALEALPV